LGRYATAKEAVAEYEKHNDVVRPLIDQKKKGRYYIEAGWLNEITIADLRKRADEEE
jgi:hypothetical protein